MSLIYLPNEILLEIANHLLPSSVKSLGSLLATCHDLHSLLTPLISAYFHKNKDTILLWAASRGVTHLVARLIKAGADINHRHPAFLGYPTVLDLAVGSGCFETVELLIRNGVDITPKLGICFHGDSVVRKAVEMKNYEMVQLLLEHGASPNERSELGYIWDDIKQDWTMCDEPALHTAVRTNNPAMVKLLLLYGADSFAKDEANRTTLEAAYDKIWERKVMGDPDSKLWFEAIELLIEARGDIDHGMELEIGEGRLVSEVEDEEMEGLDDGCKLDEVSSEEGEHEGEL